MNILGDSNRKKGKAMKIHRLAGALALAALFGTPATAAEEPSLEDLLGPGSTKDLIAAFREICFDHRGDWDGMKAATEASDFEFEPMGKIEKKEADYMAFPLMVSLKEWDKGEYACLIQSQVADTTTPDQLAEELRNAGSELAGLQFAKDDDEGLTAKSPQDGDKARVFVNVSNNADALLPIGQLAFIVE